MTEPESFGGRWRAWTGIVLAALAYAALRVAFAPADGQYTNSFGHDSAYLSIIARNLLAGRGFVNEAQWVVFLSPSSLPMPYHNGNPLFPVLVAGLARLTGLGVFQSGFIVSALSSAILMIAVTSIAACFVQSLGKAFLIGCATALFPPILGDSFALGTDALSTALFFAFVAALLRMRSPATAVAAGLLFGLAWLARPQVMLALPAVLVYVVLRWQRTGVAYLAGAMTVALVVASPWLVHTFNVWRNPFRSDSSYYLLQDYYVTHDPARFGTRYDQVIHGLKEPPGLSALVKEDPLGIPKHILRSLPATAKHLAFYWAMANPLAGLLLGLAVVAFLWRARWWSPETAAVSLLAMTVVGLLSLRNDTFELRYFSMVTVFFAMFAAAGSLMAWEAARREGRLKRLAVGVCAVLLWAMIVPSIDARVIGDMYHTNDRQVGYMQLAGQVQRRYAHGEPVVVGKWPYFYSLETAASGLAIPWDHDRERADSGLLDYMRRYHAEYVLLTDEELKYWRPSWVATVAPQDLEQVALVQNSHLYRLKH